MTKRTAEHQITKDDKEVPSDDDQTEQNDVGFSRADPAVLKGRKIVKVRRDETTGKPIITSNPFGNVSLTSSKPAVFGATASFSGFGSAASSSTDKNESANSTGFSGFVFGTKDADASKSTNTPSFGFATAQGFGEVNNATASTETEATQPTVALPENYQHQSGEEGEEVLLEVRCKTYRWGISTSSNQTTKDAPAEHSVPPSEMALGVSKSQDSNKDNDASNNSEAKKPDWHEVGTGPIRVLKNTSRVRLVQRRESQPNGSATKVLVNLMLYRESHTTMPSEKHVKITTLHEKKTEIVLCKFKLAAEASEFKANIDEIIANAKSMEDGTNESTGHVGLKEEDSSQKDESVQKADPSVDDSKAEVDETKDS